MTTYVALLRAINVGGTGKLTMADLRALCEKAGFKNPRTYIQSGNVVFQSTLAEDKVKARLQKALGEKLGKPFGAMIRTEAELQSVLERNPFKKEPPNRVLVVFVDVAPPRNALNNVVVPGKEVLHLSGRELFIHYPDGMGKSKLKTPMANTGTGRNLNTVTQLVQMAGEPAA